jgi:predicted dehydrogenase
MTVRVGLIGANRMGQTHAGCLSAIPAAKLVAVCDIITERAQAMASRFGAAVYTDYRAMLEAEKLDAVYICTPTGAHTEMAVATAERGLPFFVEKPLALTMSDAWRIAQAVEKAGVLSCVGYHWRYTNAVAKAHEILGDRPLALMAAEWYWTLPPILWLRNKDLAGGQVVDQATHLTDLFNVFGGPVTSVCAAYTLNTYTDAEFHNWDGYALTCKHAGGAVSSLHCTYALFSQIAEFAPPRVDLSARELFLRLMPSGLTVVTPRGTEQFPNSGVFHFNINQAFITAVDSGNWALVHSTVPETLRSLALTLAGTESARTGTIVNIDAFMQEAKHGRV